MAERGLDERRDTPVDRLEIRLHGRALAGDPHAVAAEPLGRRGRERQCLRVAQQRVVATGLDPGYERELVQQLRDLA